MSEPSDTAAPPRFDPRAFFALPFANHGRRLDIAYRDHGDDWSALALPWGADLVAQEATGALASGPILTLMDMASSIAVWLKAGRFVHHATLDLRIDYLRPAATGRTVIGRCECYRLTRSIAFVRGQAHDGDVADPLAHVAGTFMAAEAYW